MSALIDDTLTVEAADAAEKEANERFRKFRTELDEAKAALSRTRREAEDAIRSGDYETVSTLTPKIAPLESTVALLSPVVEEAAAEHRRASEARSAVWRRERGRALVEEAARLHGTRPEIDGKVGAVLRTLANVVLEFEATEEAAQKALVEARAAGWSHPGEQRAFVPTYRNVASQLPDNVRRAIFNLFS